jgi:hypothetical protein
MYECLSDAEALSYIQYINVGHKVVAHNIQVRPKRALLCRTLNARLCKTRTRTHAGARTRVRGRKHARHTGMLTGTRAPTQTHARARAQTRTRRRTRAHARAVWRLTQGYCPSMVVTYLMNMHILPRTIWMARHGETESNASGVFGEYSEQHREPSRTNFPALLPSLLAVAPEGGGGELWDR